MGRQVYSYKVHLIGGQIFLLRTELHPGQMLSMLRTQDAYSVHQVDGPRLYIQFKNVTFYEDVTTGEGKNEQSGN